MHNASETATAAYYPLFASLSDCNCNLLPIRWRACHDGVPYSLCHLQAVARGMHLELHMVSRLFLGRFQMFAAGGLQIVDNFGVDTLIESALVFSQQSFELFHIVVVFAEP